MAMEIDYLSKRLHKHIAPLVMLAIGLFGVAAVAVSHFQTGNLDTEITLGRGLVTQVVHIKPTANGLGHISLGEKIEPITDNKGLQGFSEAGRSAQLFLEFH